MVLLISFTLNHENNRKSLAVELPVLGTQEHSH